MDAGNLARLLIPGPENHACPRMLRRDNPFQVAGPATDPYVGIMDGFLRMGLMTTATIAHLLPVVFEVDALRVADRAADSGVGRGFILFQVYKRKPHGIRLFYLVVSRSMAVEAYPLQPLRVIHGCLAVACHARLILLGKRRQNTFVLMTHTALSVTWDGWIEPAGFPPDRKLGMGIMAGDAVSVFLGVVYLPGAVEITRKPFRHIIVACETMVRAEKIRAFLRDIPGIRMKGFLNGLPVAVSA
jgi:hypothetical protein